MAWPAFKARQQNPYTYLLYTHLRNLDVQVEEFSHRQGWRRSPHVLHLHWPEFQYRSFPLSIARYTTLLMLLRKMKTFQTKIVWTVHNLAPHDNHYPRLNRLFWNQFIPMVDGAIFLTEASRDLAYATHPGLERANSFLIPHGHYREIYPSPTPKPTARQSLQLPKDQFILLFVGALRRYKGVLSLLQTYRQVNAPQTTLIIAGKPQDHEYECELLELAANDDRVVLHLQFLSEAELSLYLSAADVVVFPYQKILNSGSAMLALSYSRPVLVPAKGSMEELQRQVGSSWLHTYHEDLTPELLERAIAWAQSNKETFVPLKEFEWGQIAEKTLQAYQTLLRT